MNLTNGWLFALAISCLMRLHSGAEAQTFDWAAIFPRITVEDVAADSAENVYTTGTFFKTVDFDPGPGTYNLTALNGAIFVLKLDGDGKFVWAKKMGGPGFEEGTGLALDGSGNILVTGTFQRIADFDPGPGVFNLSSVGGGDMFVAKLTSAGELVWAKSIGSTNFDYGVGVAVDSDENIYTTGSFQGAADFDPGPGTFVLTPNYQWDVFVSKLDRNGNFVWAGQIGGGLSEEARSLTLDGDGNVFVGGDFRETVDFDPGPGTFNLTATSDDVFVVKLDSSGEFVWAKQMGGAGFDSAEGLAVDSQSNMIATGLFQATADFNPGPGVSNRTAAGGSDTFTVKLDTAGAFIWARKLGSPNLDHAFDIAVDQSDSIYTTGFLNSGPTNGRSGDIFVAKRAASGASIWVTRMRGTGSGTALGIAISQGGSIAAAGTFQGRIDFDPGPGTFVRTVPRGGSFITKLTQP